MTTRRRFLCSCSTAIVAVSAFPLGVFGENANARTHFRSLEQISYPLLAAQINTVFRVHHAPGRVIELTLLKAPLAAPSPIVPGRRPPADAGNEKFSLIFSGSREELLTAAIHPFEHDQLGEFEMYVGQIGTLDPVRVRYQSVFNRPVRGMQAPL